MEYAIRLLGAAGLALFLVGGFTPLANAINARMGGAARLEPAQAIIVVGRGGADADGVLTNRSLRRTLVGIQLYRDGLAPVLIFSGSDAEVTARADLARGLGVPAEGILTAGGEASTTREEGAGLERLLRPRGIQLVLLVADPIDMPRARRVLERHGFTVLPAPTASSGPDNPESRLELLRDLGAELAAWAYNTLRGRP